MYSRILVPIDNSPASKRGLNEAIALASVLGSELRLLHVVDAYAFAGDVAAARFFEQLRENQLKAGEHTLAQARRRADDAGLRCSTALRETGTHRVADVLLAEADAQECELIVMGTHGRRGLNRLALGSDAERVVRSARVPVLLVRAGESTPADVAGHDDPAGA